MNLYDKVKLYVDYNNHYTVQKALRTLDIEFNKAIKTNNTAYVDNIIEVVRKMYDDLSSSYRESADKGETMSYAQKSLANKMRRYIAYLSHKAKISPQKEIKQIISLQ